ncbi:MAG: tripartite tricarboxylate transporter substrate binding protein [Betaproteobacteria bacterium]
MKPKLLSFSLIIHLLISCVCGLISFSSFSQSSESKFPEKPITIVVAYAPGGQGDVFARLISERLTSKWGVSVIVDNKPGASGMIGTRYVVAAKPDGYVLLLAQTGEISINPWVMKNLGYNPSKDLKPIVLVGDAPLVMSVATGSKFKNISEVMSFAKMNPNSLSYASSGTATPGHLCAAALDLYLNGHFTHVPYKGAGPATTDLLGGQVDFFFSSAAGIMPHINSGKVRGLAVSTKKRISALAQTPTVAESGIPNFSFSLWGGLFAPAGTPSSIVEKINTAVNEILQETEIKNRLERDGVLSQKNSVIEFSEFVNQESKKYEELVKTTGIKSEAN